MLLGLDARFDQALSFEEVLTYAMQDTPLLFRAAQTRKMYSFRGLHVILLEIRYTIHYRNKSTA